MVDHVCCCGETYDQFRTGLTFKEVKAMMFSGDTDPTTWRSRSRNAVLGYWRELKLGLWSMHLGYCESALDALDRQQAA